MDTNDLHDQLDAARAAEDWALVKTLEERLRTTAGADIPWPEVGGGVTPEEFEEVRALIKLGRECRQVFDDFPEWAGLPPVRIASRLQSMLRCIRDHGIETVGEAIRFRNLLIDLKAGEMGATREEAIEALELLERRAAVKLEADRKIIEQVEDIARESLGATQARLDAAMKALGRIAQTLGYPGLFTADGHTWGPAEIAAEADEMLAWAGGALLPADDEWGRSYKELATEFYGVGPALEDMAQEMGYASPGEEWTDKSLPERMRALTKRMSSRHHGLVEGFGLLAAREADRNKRRKVAGKRLSDVIAQALPTPPRNPDAPNPLTNLQRALQSLEAAGFHVEVRLTTGQNTLEGDSNG